VFAREINKMKRVEQNATDLTSNSDPKPALEGNGSNPANGGPVSVDLSVILASLQTMRDGDFSVRLAGY